MLAPLSSLKVLQILQASKLKQIINFMDKEVFSSSKYFKHDILLECLNNERHDELLTRSLCLLEAQQILPPDDVAKVKYVLDFKQRLLEQLLLCQAIEPDAHKSLVGCLRSVIVLADIVPKIRAVGSANSTLAHPGFVPLSSLSRLTVSYLHLLVTGLSREHKMGAGSFQMAFSQLIDDDRRNGYKTLGKMRDLVRGTDDLRVASGLLEVMSYFLTERSDKLVRILTDESFQVLHTAYALSSDECGKRFIPFSVHTMTRSLKIPATALQIVHRILAQTVWRCSNDAPPTSSELGKVVELQRTLLLRHFGLLCHSRERSILFDSHMTQLLADVTLFVNTMSVDKEDSSTVGLSSTFNLSPKKMAVKRTIAGCCLTWSTFTSYFETLVHVSVASLAVFRPELPVATCDRPSPYSCLQDAAISFNTLVLTYGEHLDAFPRKTMSTLFQASRLMLEALSLQVRLCTEWRNKQPIQNQSDSGCLDYFRDFISILASCVCASLQDLGARWMNHNDASNAAQKGKILCTLVEKAKKLLKDVSLAHNLSSPSFDVRKVSTPHVANTLSQQVPSMTNAVNKKRRVIPEKELVNCVGANEGDLMEEEETTEACEFTALNDWGGLVSMDDCVIVAAPRILPSM